MSSQKPVASSQKPVASSQNDMERQTHRRMNVWQKAHVLALEVYKLTMVFPGEEKYGLVSQMRRAAVSVPANIVEGFYRRSNRDKSHFYNVSQSSLEELRYFLELAKDLKYITDKRDVSNLCEEVSKMLSALRRSLTLLFLVSGYWLLAT